MKMFCQMQNNNRRCRHLIIGQVHIAYAQMPLINAHSDVSSKAGGLNFGLSLLLYQYLVYMSREDSGESAHISRLA